MTGILNYNVFVDDNYIVEIIICENKQPLYKLKYKSISDPDTDWTYVQDSFGQDILYKDMETAQYDAERILIL